MQVILKQFLCERVVAVCDLEVVRAIEQANNADNVV